MKKLYIVRAIGLQDKVTFNRYISSRCMAFDTRAEAIEYRDTMNKLEQEDKDSILMWRLEVYNISEAEA